MTFSLRRINQGPTNSTKPHWLPTPHPPKPGMAMDMTPVTEEELKKVIKKSKPSSASSPVDKISYQIFKKCPSLHDALQDLFNRVIMEGKVPSSWRVAVMKLIPKRTIQQHL